MTTAASTGQALRRLREIAGLTLDQVAELADVSPTYLSRVETGQCNPSIKWLGVVSKALAASIASKADGGSDMGLTA
ncbi:hypothetical protein BO226_17655 [Rhodococcus sp. 2G]|uniref:helix-turn-helix domain-containing protein n=1 Tax=Rhodococcus sp. 2G TaxID=1570939 RepID=UPI0009043406|nr:helix-turn-helix transcriptional regulator [Rhodococcus sp. 2G]APE10799.1 hypothetical protein BO226_17655 [Rhodococcus sp. 2G]